MASIELSDFVHQVAPLPGMTWTPIRVLSTLHWYWRWSYKKDLYTDPSNWLPLGAGAALNAVGGDGWLRTAAHIVLVVHRTKLYIDLVHSLVEEAEEITDAINGTYSNYPVVPLRSSPKPYWIGRATRRSWEVKVKRFHERLMRIVVAVVRVTKALFLVAMHAVEIYDAFYRRREAFTEVFLNGGECLTGVISSVQKLYAYCEENPHVMELLYKKWPGLQTVVEGVEKPLKQIAEFGECLPEVSERQKRSHMRGAALMMMLVMPISWIPQDYRRELYRDQTEQ